MLIYSTASVKSQTIKNTSPNHRERIYRIYYSYVLPLMLFNNYSCDKYFSTFITKC